MRQGPEYSQRGIEWHNHSAFIRVPLELVEELEGIDCVVWVENSDGTITLKYK